MYFPCYYNPNVGQLVLGGLSLGANFRLFEDYNSYPLCFLALLSLSIRSL